MRQKTVYSLLGLIIAATLGSSLGCCGPMGCGGGLGIGPGCAAQSGGCYDCEGGFGPRQMASGPIDALRQAKRSLVCGGGCGEVYYGEWISTPPHCNDPCCGTEFTGGAVRARPFCVAASALRPVNLVTALYGKRHCDSCGGEVGCDACLGGAGEEYYDETSVISSGSPGCSSCAARAATGHAGSVATRQTAMPVSAPPARMATRNAGAPAASGMR